MNKSYQLKLSDIYDDCNKLLEEDTPAFIKLLEDNLNISEYIPASFYMSFYQHFGRTRKYSLEAFVTALVIQLVFSIPTVKLLRQFLVYSKPLRKFCGFDTLPDEGKFSTFKKVFAADLKVLFEHLVEITEPICQKLSPELSSVLIFDTTGIEAYVTENNPKYLNKIIKQQKYFAKNNPTFDPHKAAYANMPKHSSASKDIKQLYINGHFCYVYKYGLLTNGLGVIRHISPLDADFKNNHLSPDNDKSVGDNTALIPALSDFFATHSSFDCDIFIGDSAFDSADTYKALLGDLHFSKAVIPLNVRHQKYSDPDFNEFGHPVCQSTSLPMRYEGAVHGKDRPARDKWVCPKAFCDTKGKRHTACDRPCTNSPCGRMFYTYPEKNLRMYPGIVRNTEKWNTLYKIRPVVEKTINQFKEHMGVGNIKSRNQKTFNASMYMAGITQLLTLILADKLSLKKFRSLKILIA